MLAIHLSLAAVAVAVLALRPRRNSSAAVVATIAVVELALGAPRSGAITVVGPVIAFLAAAMTLAAIANRSGLGDRAALALARGGRGHPVALYGLVCGLCAVLTAVVSLDGAVVLMVPIVLALHRRHGAPLAPLLLGVVGVANAASIAVPQGNPTNLVVIGRLHMSLLGFTGQMLVPGITGTLVCAIAVALFERRRLRVRYQPPQSRPEPLSREQRVSVLALGGAALAAWAAPFDGIPPWWPFVAAVSVSLLATRCWSAVVVPWRVAIQIAALAVIAGAVGVRAPEFHAVAWPTLLIVALATGGAAALINNLPASVWASSLLTSGPIAAAAVVGLAVGALAAPQGSVATLIAADLAGPEAPRFSVRRLMPIALAALLAAILALRVSL
jgi:arsenical pump membrane protein